MPDCTVEKSNQFVISRVGQDFFDKYMTYDHAIYYGSSKSCTKCRNLSHYRVVYELRMPNKPYVDESIEFSVDTLGNVLSEAGQRGLPDCVTNPDECDFPIDEARAIEIAKEAGLEAGIKEWTAGFHWGARHQTYVWSVQNTLSESAFSYEGEGFTIDANSGEVLQEYLYGGVN